jgi:aconitate hydratase
LREGVTATDLVLRVTEMLRKAKVVGKFVEFHGEGAASFRSPIARRSRTWRRSTARRWASFPVDEETCAYLKATGRAKEHVDACATTTRRRACLAFPRKASAITASCSISISERSCRVSLVQSDRRIESSFADLKTQFNELMLKPIAEGGYGKTEDDLWTRYHVGDRRRPPTRSVAAAVSNDPKRFRCAGNHQTSAKHERLDGNGNGQQPSHSGRVAEVPEEFPTCGRLIWAMAMF